ncbi:hypothetical protein L207DRAFT_578704 [Hyaloscypha variabilis F]|uniref:RING-type domain-containing protein n=1 Tax=Hyaloscypha variabilis (strain UAMH 11265 / GT02V1 / F) TaxID=1149755 RepID=A0A2J6S4V4_HYAVF|nr:hypothetical protein L207DRAFT_578704 [Hyaloscypha variabilis F]
MPQSSQQARCGQFTFYFSRCGHATSHNYHRASNSGTDCNRNCIHDKKIDYWFWAGKDKRCSFCGLGQDHGFGTQHPIPEDGADRELLFERIKEGMSLGEPDEVYNARFDEAAGWYNRKAIEKIGLADARENEQTPSLGQLRTKRRLRHENRREIRRLRAKRRTEIWVQNVRDEQYQAVKGNLEVGKQPFIAGEVGDPYMDLFSKILLNNLPRPIDNCAMCQYALNDIAECGSPYSLPCGHMYHLLCMDELFNRRADAEEKEVYKCPLCNAWYQDLRQVPDFYDSFWSHKQDFDSNASSSVLSESDDGEEKGDPPPPWIFRPEQLRDVPEWLENRTGTRSNARLRGIVQDSITARNEVATGGDEESSSPRPRRRPGTNALLNHFRIAEPDSDVEPDTLENMQPEVLQETSTLEGRSSTETGNGSLREGGDGQATSSLPAHSAPRGHKKKRKSGRSRGERDDHPRKRRKQ